jgi:hypothetical protein
MHRFLLVAFMAAAPVTHNLDERLAKWKPVEMKFDSSRFSARERQLVEKLVEATRYLDDIYWRQSDPAGLALYKSTRDPKLKRMLMINGSRWDLLDENRPWAMNRCRRATHSIPRA